MTENRPNHVIGIDLGGTRLRVALADRAGRIIRHRVVRTLAEEGRNAVLGRIIAETRTILDPISLVDLATVAAAVPGPVDPYNGIVYRPPNLPGWGDVELRSILEQKLTVPVVVGNDANVAALAEHHFGAGRGASHLVFITVSTGIGGGIVNDGELLLGAWGGAAEIGHMTIDLNGPRCTCGNFGCLEAMASGHAIAREAARRIASGATSVLTERVRGNLDELRTQLIVQAAREGDPLADQVIKWAAYNLGVGLANVMHMFDPDLIAIGGGVSNAWDLLIPTIRRALRERAMEVYVRRTRIVRSELGDDAGMLGAVALAIDQAKYLEERKAA
ncbi:MAG TPA: ROK family protein [Chloroflexota bacterium]|nr:ROK family protein [Chloroflexota bacterium]